MPGEIDWFLQLIVHSVDDGVGFSGITLSVGGLLVSGDLVDAKRYFEGFTKDLAAGGTSPEIVELFTPRHNPYSIEREKANPTQYIHLANARIFHPGGNPIPGSRGTWWRGKLSAVDGFFLGKLFEE